MTLADRSGAMLMRMVWRVAAALPPAQASHLGAAILGRSGPWIRKQRMLTGNLRIAFPDWPESRIAATARASWASLGRVIAEFPHLGELMAPGEAARVEVVDETRLLARAARGQPVVMASGHFANWELLAGAASRHGVPLTVVHAARANPLVEALVDAHRQALGCAFLERRESVLAMRRHIRAGRSIGVLLDQRYEDGEPVPFFGRPALTATAPALLAVRHDLPFAPVRAERLEGCRFRITVEPALRPDRTLGAPRAIALDLMTRLNRRFEAWIRERPEQWLCIKRRWPKPSSPMPAVPLERLSVETAATGLREEPTRRLEAS
jgi:Kdo2-lipid IVA lauroyltransferase/acyltransferase